MPEEIKEENMEKQLIEIAKQIQEIAKKNDCTISIWADRYNPPDFHIIYPSLGEKPETIIDGHRFRYSFVGGTRGETP